MFETNESTRKYRIWQRDPLAIRIYSRNMLEQNLNYIHNNPLQEKWKLANAPEDYHWSSAGYYLTNTDKFNIIKDYRERI
jgi:hypothetical protein